MMAKKKAFLITMTLMFSMSTAYCIEGAMQRHPLASDEADMLVFIARERSFGQAWLFDHIGKKTSLVAAELEKESKSSDQYEWLLRLYKALSKSQKTYEEIGSPLLPGMMFFRGQFVGKVMISGELDNERAELYQSMVYNCSESCKMIHGIMAGGSKDIPLSGERRTQYHDLYEKFSKMHNELTGKSGFPLAKGDRE